MAEPGGGPLPRQFYVRDVAGVARSLLGQRLVRLLGGRRLSGLIGETEAYAGPGDRASHASRRTPRSAIMYGPPGYAYVYFIYGMYYCLNAVAEGDGRPGAVLIRALFPQEGVEIMRARRASPRGDHLPAARLTDGPGKLCRALDITGALNGADLTQPGALWIERGVGAPDAEVFVTSRIGVRGDALALERPWRFVWRGNG